MREKKPFCFRIRLRPDKYNSYQQIHFYVRVEGSPYRECGLGIFLEKDQWQPYKPACDRQVSQPTTPLLAKLDEVRSRVFQIYDQQMKQAQAEGWQVTAHTIKRQYMGKPPVLSIGPIALCCPQWAVISYSRTGREGRSHGN